MKEKYDFLSLGKIKVTELLSKELNEYANFIGETFGEEAQLEFEVGAALSVSQYAKTLNSKVEQNQLKISYSKILTNYNEINNSCFGRTGTNEKYPDEVQDDTNVIYKKNR